MKHPREALSGAESLVRSLCVPSSFSEEHSHLSAKIETDSKASSSYGLQEIFLSEHLSLASSLFCLADFKWAYLDCLRDMWSSNASCSHLKQLHFRIINSSLSGPGDL
eukprot:XP_001710252.1 Hypothetical protein GL50803_31185 [Giardia lamblia ATCC 50803]